MLVRGLIRYNPTVGFTSLPPLRRLPLFALILVGIALGGAIVLAASRKSPSLTSGSFAHPAFLAHVRGVQVVRVFPAVGGLVGYVLQVGATRSIAFGLDHGHYVLLGRLLDAEGHNLTERYADRYLLKGGVWDALSRTAWIARGPARPKAIVYAFVDPNCPYCHVFWERAGALYAQGLQVRYILVAVIRPSSVNKAAWILAGHDPAQRLVVQEQDYGRKGAPRIAHPDARELAILRHDTRLMLALGLTGTPGFVYHLAGTGPVRFLDGLPERGHLAALFLPPRY